MLNKEKTQCSIFLLNELSINGRFLIIKGSSYLIRFTNFKLITAAFKILIKTCVSDKFWYFFRQILSPLCEQI